MYVVDYYGKIDNVKLCYFGGDRKTTLDVSCIVLAGGRSTRLGRNKVVEIIGNQSLLERVISNLTYFSDDIIVVSAKESSLPQLSDYPNLKMVQDIYPGKGSLGGVYSGLVSAKSFYNLVVACDMPFLNRNLLQYLIDAAPGYDTVVPRLDDGTLEPLHAIYSKNCIPTFERFMRENNLKILDIFPAVKTRYVGNAEIDKLDPEHVSFFNVNTEADLLSGRELARKEGFNRD
jgi:molybdenum cofactor guanylyltransferase